jgi:hypothetical protein
VRVRFRGNVFTEPLLRTGRLFIRLLHSNGCIRCFYRGLCLATGIYMPLFKSYIFYYIKSVFVLLGVYLLISQ